MKLQLAKPCKNCPFAVAETRIRFACRERAEEIEEQAYRQGFPCHLSAELRPNRFDPEEEGYEFGPNTQHCAGAALMYLNAGYDTWPGIDNRELSARWVAKLEPNLHLAFENEDAFFEANEAIADRNPEGGNEVPSRSDESGGSRSEIAQNTPPPSGVGQTT